jgi:hypothetical protein
VAWLCVRMCRRIVSLAAMKLKQPVPDQRCRICNSLLWLQVSLECGYCGDCRRERPACRGGELSGQRIAAPRPGDDLLILVPFTNSRSIRPNLPAPAACSVLANK